MVNDPKMNTVRRTTWVLFCSSISSLKTYEETTPKSHAMPPKSPATSHLQKQTFPNEENRVYKKHLCCTKQLSRIYCFKSISFPPIHYNEHKGKRIRNIICILHFWVDWVKLQAHCNSSINIDLKTYNFVKNPTDL